MPNNQPINKLIDNFYHHIVEIDAYMISLVKIMWDFFFLLHFYVGMTVSLTAKLLTQTKMSVKEKYVMNHIYHWAFYIFHQISELGNNVLIVR